MIDKNIEKILNNAFTKANKLRFEFFTTEHMLLSLCEYDSLIHSSLIELNASKSELIYDLNNFLDTHIPKLEDDKETTVPTSTFHKIINNAISQRQAADKEYANGLHIIISILEEESSHACFYLRKQGITKLSVMQLISQSQLQNSNINNEYTKDNEENEEQESALEKYCINLNDLAKKGNIEGLIGRKNELSRMIQILARRKKNNPILVGEAGVGKTAIAEGLAKKIVDKEVPKPLLKNIIYSVDLGSMVAGSKYRGDFEKKIKELIKEVSEDKNIIIFIDEIHTIVGAGATSENTLDASNLIKPALSSGDIRCIGATTYEEYKLTFEKNSALARRFQKIDVPATTPEETINIIKGILPSFEKFHKVKYNDDVIPYAVELSQKYINDRQLPDKAIDIIDEVAAMVRTQKKVKKIISKKDIEKIISKITNFPEKTISNDNKKSLLKLESNIKQHIFGQDHAINTVSYAIKFLYSGLKDNDKPIASYLFAGPTGVGKTELAKIIAKETGMKFLRFDMSEYREKHTISKLIGSPAGYSGHGKGGLLTNAVSNNPYSILLLDEIEKAHSDIFNLLLQVMDYGTLTDSNGKVIDFSHTLLIMTSNAGASTLEKNQLGFTKADNQVLNIKPAIKKTFTPEFRNRLTEVIQFNPLEKQVVSKITDKFIKNINIQIKEKDIEIIVDKSARNWLLENGYNKLMGARPMSRIIEKNIKRPLSEKILFENIKKGEKIKIKFNKNSKTLVLENS